MEAEYIKSCCFPGNCSVIVNWQYCDFDRSSWQALSTSITGQYLLTDKSYFYRVFIFGIRRSTGSIDILFSPFHHCRNQFCHDHLRRHQTVLSTTAKVKPIPGPPTSICAFSIALRRVQANSASASSAWYLRLLIRSPGRPETSTAKSSLHCDRISSVALPSRLLIGIEHQRPPEASASTLI